MNPEPEHDETCQLCNSAAIHADGCTACGAERYSDLEGRIYYTDAAVMKDLERDPEGKISDSELDHENEESVQDEYPEEGELGGLDPEGDLDPDADDGDDAEGDEGESESDDGCTYCGGSGEIEPEEGDDEDDMELCPECGGSGEDDGKDEEGEQDEDEFPDNEEGDMEIPPNEEPLGEDEDPFPEPVKIRILSVGSKIGATKWLLAVTEMRDGKPYKIKKAKALINQIKYKGRTAVITELPPFYSKIVHMAARDCGVVLDMDADKREEDWQELGFSKGGIVKGGYEYIINKDPYIIEEPFHKYTNDSGTEIVITNQDGTQIKLAPGDEYTFKSTITYDDQGRATFG